MNTLVAARHGRYDSRTGRLSELGQEETRQLARLLKPRTDGKRVLLLVSEAPRGQEAGEIFKEELGLPAVKVHRALWSDPEHRVNHERLLRLLRLPEFADAEVVILMTHLEYASDFPGFYAEHALGKRLPHNGDMPYGSAQVLDCVAKTVEVIDA